MSISSEFSHVSSQRTASISPEMTGFVPAGGWDLNLGFSTNIRRTNGSAPEFFQPPEKMADLKSLDLFPQQAGFGISSDVDSSVQAPQMTIFYDGQVYVFDNYPENRAGEVMLMAGGEGSIMNIPVAGQPVLVENPADSLSSTSPVSPRNLNPPPPVAGALPMARRASIQRFLEKRRNRLTARALYLNKIAGACENSWLGLAVQPQV